MSCLSGILLLLKDAPDACRNVFGRSGSADFVADGMYISSLLALAFSIVSEYRCICLDVVDDWDHCIFQRRFLI